MAVTTDPSKTGISETDALALTGTTLASNVVNASLNSITPTGGTLGVAGAQSIVSSDLGANPIRVVNDNGTAGVRTYTFSDGDGLILNQYYAVAGGPAYMRYADIVANMADVSATTMRFLVKGTGVDAEPVLVLNSGGAAVTGIQTITANSASPASTVTQNGAGPAIAANKFISIAGSSDVILGLNNTTPSTGRHWLVNSNADGTLSLGVAGVGDYAVLSQSGSLFSANSSSPALTVTQNGTGPHLRINQSPTAETVVCTHTAVINLDGTDYKFPCLAA